jgi:tRNA A37 N6-isopentenylltransferase MiaA
MNPTLADLISTCLDCKFQLAHAEAQLHRGEPTEEQESLQLALNCLEERFQSMIDERITQMLKELRP